MLFDIVKISLAASVFSFLGDEDMIFNWYRKLIMKLPNWINRPLGNCNLCITGQACFWGYLAIYSQEYNLINHLFFASAGIFLSSIYAIIWYYE